MSHVRAVYELRRFSRTTDPDFQSALRLYVRLIPGPARTQSNEIVYWLENYQQFKPDEFCVCGFYSNDAIIGYAQFAYFHAERIIAFDYLLLHEAHRGHGEYFQFVKLLKEWIDEQHWELDYVTAEVSADCDVANDRVRLVDLFQQVGFAVVNCLYHQPHLGLNNPQSDIKVHFLVRPSAKMLTMPAPVFVKIVETIYFKHYQRWYRPFLDAPFEYDKLLRQRFAELTADAEHRKVVELDGIKSPVTAAPTPPAARSRRRRSYLNAVCAAAMVLVICFCLLLFQKIFERDTNTVITYLAASLLVSATAFALFYQKGQWVLGELLKLFKASGKGKLR
jgi:hypothetical protein